MDDMQKARLVIDDIDQKMQQLFLKRMDAVKAIALYKKSNNYPIFDEAREKSIIEKRKAELSDSEYSMSYEHFIKAVMELSKSFQKQVINHESVGYCGTLGAFSHNASSQLFPDFALKNYSSFDKVCIELMNDSISYGVLPFENSFTGSVGEVLDLLHKHDLYIIDTYDLLVSQNLLGVKGAKIEQIKKVYSKDQALLQSANYLNGRSWEQIPMENTAIAAKFVSEQADSCLAAIGAKENAQLYNLDILAENIQGGNDNTTRFIVVGRKPNYNGNHFSLMLTIAHQSGSLAQAVSCFASFNLNMSMIVSRANAQQSWQYYFYIEVCSAANKQLISDLCTQLSKYCSGVKFLGSFNK